MKKLSVRVALFFSLIGMLFTSCLGFWEEVLHGIACPINSIILYDHDRGITSDVDEYNPIEFNVGDTYEVWYDIEYSASTNQATFILKSDDTSVAIPLESEKKTTTTSGYFTIKAVGEGECWIKMYIEGYENSYPGYGEVCVKVGPEKTVKIVDANGNKINNLKLGKGTSMYLQYTNTYDKKPVKWSSTSRYILDIDSYGYIRAVDKGTVTVTLSSFDGAKKDTCEVIVFDSNGWNILISNVDPITDIHPKDVIKFTSTVTVDDGISNKINWESDNKSVASVNSKGEVTAISEGDANIYAVLAENSSIKSNSIKIHVNGPVSPANQFFWGKWQRMDNGEIYEIQETKMICGSEKYTFASSTDTELVVSGNFGSFVKDTEGIIKWHDSSKNIDIPFYRQGGTNLKYKVRLVGFADEIGGSTSNANNRAAGIDTKKLTIKSQSEKYSTYNREKTLDDYGEIELEAPVQGDIQTLTVTDNSTGEVVVVPGLKIDTDGANMGTIPLVGKKDYSLKVTGTIDDSKTNNGYLYGNNYKTYPLTLTITNISEIMSATSSCKIYPKTNDLDIKIVNSRYSLDDVGISAMLPGATKQINLEVSYGNLVNKYVDTEIIIEVTNMNTMRTWVDYVPLRFFAGQMPVTISAASTEGNNESLNGFLIYPDGNSTFFNIKSNANDDTNYYKTLYIPIFSKNESNPYRMVFCGANVTGNLRESGEMFYTVNFNSTTPNKPELTMTKYYLFGENGKANGNDSEDKAYAITESFEAYLGYQDIDFYTLKVDSSSTKVYE